MSSVKIAYERNLTGSYMVISAPGCEDMDEKLMLRKKLPGLLPVEKAYVNGGGQYWYNISGKQSLNCYCRTQEIGMEFIERMIVSICNEMELLEWNLIRTGCLVLDPDLVFITNSNREFIFTVYPEPEGCVEKAFQELMEYLLTKIDHKDAEAVRASYGIYEKTLEEGFSITDIRDCVADAKKTALQQSSVQDCGLTEGYAGEAAQEVFIREASNADCPEPEQKKKRDGLFTKVKAVLSGLLAALGMVNTKSSAEKVKREKKGKKEKKKIQEPGIEPVYPEEEIKPEPVPVIHPTVCLAAGQEKPHGMLLYQGPEQMEDIRLEAKVSRIGHGNQVEVRINKDTVSQVHARIDKAEDAYYIEDLNSTNGTFVNNEPLAYNERRKLNMNDIICFADIRYRFT